MEVYFNDSTGSEKFCESMNQQTAVLSSNEDISEIYTKCFINFGLYPAIRYKSKNQSNSCWTYLTSKTIDTVSTYELCYMDENSGIVCVRKNVKKNTRKVSTVVVVVIIAISASLVGLIVVVYKKLTKVSIKKISILGNRKKKSKKP